MAATPIAREPQFVAALAGGMPSRHRTDETYALCASQNLIVSGWTVRLKPRLRNQSTVSRLTNRFASITDMKLLSLKTSVVLTGINSINRTRRFRAAANSISGSS